MYHIIYMVYNMCTTKIVFSCRFCFMSILYTNHRFRSRCGLRCLSIAVEVGVQALAGARLRRWRKRGSTPWKAMSKSSRIQYLQGGAPPL